MRINPVLFRTVESFARWKSRLYQNWKIQDMYHMRKHGDGTFMNGRYTFWSWFLEQVTVLWLGREPLWDDYREQHTPTII
jgi:hypothetical protein